MNITDLRPRILFCFLFSLYLLMSACPAAAAENAAGHSELSAWDIAFETGNGMLEEADPYSLVIPLDYSGFSIGFQPGQENPLLMSGDPVHTDESGVRYYTLTEEQAEQIFVLPREISSPDGSTHKYYGGEGNHHPSLFAANPDRSVLFWDGWLIADNDGHYNRAFFIQRSREILVLNGGDGPAHPDDRGGIPRTLLDFLNQYNTVSRDEWSADGRYVFFDIDYRSLFRLSLPWLFDSRTGEIIPMFTPDGLNQRIPDEFNSDGLFCTMIDGHFSRDGQYFYMILFGNLPEWGGERSRMLMRWNLRSGDVEQCLRLDDTASAFYEIADSRILIISAEKAVIVRNSESVFIEEEISWPGLRSASLTVWNKLRGYPVAEVTLNTAEYCSAVSVLRNQPEGENNWYLIPNRPVADAFVSVTPDELISAVLTENNHTQNSRLMSEYQYAAGMYCFINSIVQVEGTPYLVISYSGISQEKESWTTFWNQETRTMLLNTETLEMKPIRIARNAEETEDLSTSDSFLTINKTIYRLIPDVPAKPESAADDPAASEKQEQWEAYIMQSIKGLDLLYHMNSDYTEYNFRLLNGSDYTYELHLPETGELVCTNQSYQSSGFLVTNDIQVLNGLYRVTVDLMLNTDWRTDPEAIIHPSLRGFRYEASRLFAAPLAMTEDRYSALLERMNKSDSMKLKQMYTKKVPEKLLYDEDRDELIAKFPSISEQTLYVLIHDNAVNRQKVESYLNRAGYTWDDFELDMQLVNPEAMDMNITYPVSYVFHADVPVCWTRGPADMLLTLCDRLASTAYRQYASANPKPDSVESLPLAGSYTFSGGISCQVTVDSTQETDGHLILTFSVVPQNKWGLFPAE